MLARRGFVALATLPHRLRAIGKIEPFFREVEQVACRPRSTRDWRGSPCERR
jgi:hypothetical protein